MKKSNIKRREKNKYTKDKMEEKNKNNKYRIKMMRYIR